MSEPTILPEQVADGWTMSMEMFVSCPACAFTFDAGHVNDDGSGLYSCPNCAEEAAVARAEHAEKALAWRTGVPSKHGYYLVAWERGGFGEPCVSELWFNPEARPKWWTTRGYLGDRSHGMAGAIENDQVIAWMPKPAATSREALAGTAAPSDTCQVCTDGYICEKAPGCLLSEVIDAADAKAGTAAPAEPPCSCGDDRSVEALVRCTQARDTATVPVERTDVASHPHMDAEWLAREPCDGSSECDAAIHVHGCYADNGNCDEPREHAGAAPAEEDETP